MPEAPCTILAARCLWHCTLLGKAAVHTLLCSAVEHHNITWRHGSARKARFLSDLCKEEGDHNEPNDIICEGAEGLTECQGFGEYRCSD